MAIAAASARRAGRDRAARRCFSTTATSASGPGDSLQALRPAGPADPLAEPGSADLTAHVDFAALAAAGARRAGAAVHGPVPQGLFLARLGLFQRTDRWPAASRPCGPPR